MIGHNYLCTVITWLQQGLWHVYFDFYTVQMFRLSNNLVLDYEALCSI